MIVKTREDYDKVLKGDIVPTSVGVRRYIPPKRVTEEATQGAGGGSFVTEKPTGTIPKTKDGHLLIGQIHNNKSAYYDPASGAYSYVAPLPLLKKDGKPLPPN